MHEPYYDPEYWGCDNMVEAKLPDGDTIIILERVNPFHTRRFYVDAFDPKDPAGCLDMFHGPFDYKEAGRYVREEWIGRGGNPEDAEVKGIGQALRESGLRVCVPHR